MKDFIRVHIEVTNTCNYGECNTPCGAKTEKNKVLMSASDIGDILHDILGFSLKFARTHRVCIPLYARGDVSDYDYSDVMVWPTNKDRKDHKIFTVINHNYTLHKEHYNPNIEYIARCYTETDLIVAMGCGIYKKYFFIINRLSENVSRIVNLLKNLIPLELYPDMHNYNNSMEILLSSYPKALVVTKPLESMAVCPCFPKPRECMDPYELIIRTHTEGRYEDRFYFVRHQFMGKSKKMTHQQFWEKFG